MKDIKLNIRHIKQPEEIVIAADAAGLRYLSAVCLRLIGKGGPAAHWHLMDKMGTLSHGSINTRIVFEELCSSESVKSENINISYFKQPEEVVIAADANGLRYLSEVCLRLIDKSGPAAHWHLMKNMEPPDLDAIDLRIIFIKDSEGS